MVAGLVVGKPIGVMVGGWTVARFTRAELDPSIAWRDVIGVAVLAGIGFTVSLLVADLSFGVEREAAKTAVLAGSVVSACSGLLVLGHRTGSTRRREELRQVSGSSLCHSGGMKAVQLAEQVPTVRRATTGAGGPGDRGVPPVRSRGGR